MTTWTTTPPTEPGWYWSRGRDCRIIPRDLTNPHTYANAYALCSEWWPVSIAPPGGTDWRSLCVGILGRAAHSLSPDRWEIVSRGLDDAFVAECVIEYDAAVARHTEG